jgi:hypothetical protein
MRVESKIFLVQPLPFVNTVHDNKKCERNKYDLQKPHCRILLTALIDVCSLYPRGSLLTYIYIL